mmetsp:Transcript_86693/g.280101  ORF Transcript_86693/g.280101 Transcript_86693/m.280101 type:complete len:311 (-) Transcript_86693:318-1250(-)
MRRTRTRSAGGTRARRQSRPREAEAAEDGTGTTGGGGEAPPEGATVEAAPPTPTRILHRPPLPGHLPGRTVCLLAVWHLADRHLATQPTMDTRLARGVPCRRATRSMVTALVQMGAYPGGLQTAAGHLMVFLAFTLAMACLRRASDTRKAFRTAAHHRVSARIPAAHGLVSRPASGCRSGRRRRSLGGRRQATALRLRASGPAARRCPGPVARLMVPHLMVPRLTVPRPTALACRRKARVGQADLQACRHLGIWARRPACWVLQQTRLRPSSKSTVWTIWQRSRCESCRRTSRGKSSQRDRSLDRIPPPC